MKFKFTYPPFCKKSKFFKTLRPTSSQYNLLINTVEFLIRDSPVFSSIENRTRPFLALDKILRITSI